MGLPIAHHTNLSTSSEEVHLVLQRTNKVTFLSGELACEVFCVRELTLSAPPQRKIGLDVQKKAEFL